MNKIIFAIALALITSTTQAAIPVKLQQFIEQLKSEKENLQGGVIAVLYKGEVVYKAAFGHCKGDAEPITASTLLPLASVSKPVTAIAVALLVDKGDLSFDEQFKLPYCKHPVNLKNILGHTTGYRFPGNSQIEQGLPRSKILAQLKNKKPKCQPGQCYAYSNFIFGLTEEALNTKQLSLQDAIKNLRRVLKTDGIQILPIAPNLQIAHPHTQKPLPFPPYYPKAAAAAAGIFASLDAMIEIFKLSFGYRPDLISQPLLDELFVPISINDDIQRWGANWWQAVEKIKSYYGLGWRVLKVQDKPGKDLIFHSGMISGVNSFIGFIPSEEIGIIFLANQRSKVPAKSGLLFWRGLID